MSIYYPSGPYPLDPGLLKIWTHNEVETQTKRDRYYDRIDGDIILAMIEVESGGNPWQVRFERLYRWLWEIEYKSQHWRATTKLLDGIMPSASTLWTEITAQRTSWGLLQIMGSTAREWGMKGWLTQLLIPQINLEYGIRFFRHLVERYQGNVTDAVAAYNQGSNKRGEDGNYMNQKHVDKVLAVMERYREGGG